MKEAANRMTFLYYQLPDGWLTLLVLMMEWTGFVIIAHEISKRTPILIQFVLTPIAGIAWIMCWDYFSWALLLHYGLIRW